MSHAYDARFMSYADRSSRAAAQRIAGLIAGTLTVRSVLDIGCARGTWLDVWSELGASEIQGVDGDYVDRAQLVIPAAQFQAWNLAHPLDLSRDFDLVQSLEVAEHIAAEHAAVFVENLVRHSRGIVLFSAAPPGQGGEFHINEQPYDYWRALFAVHGYHAHDWIRPQIAGEPSISFWYRYNIFLYVHEAAAPRLPEAIRATRVPAERPLADISPTLFQWRKQLVRRLPEGVKDGLARFKAHYFPSGRW
jgi:hypothetical protein